MKNLPESRGFIKWLLLSIVTLGIYSLVMMYHISEEINLVAAKDGKKTMNYLLLIFIVGPITLGIGAVVWMHRICARIGAQLETRKLDYKFGAGTFWGWGVLGALIVVGPIVFMHKLLVSMNKLNADFNSKKA